MRRAEIGRSGSAGAVAFFVGGEANTHAHADPHTHAASLCRCQATATFHSQWQTALFGALDAEHVMSLRFEEGQWAIDWQPTLILPQLGRGVTLALLEEQLERGDILDVQQQILASNEQVITVGVVPALIPDSDRQEIIEQLAPIVSVDAAEIEEKIVTAPPDWFVPVGDIDFDTSVVYLDLLAAMPGVERRPHPLRVYPQEETGAHLVGTLGGIPASQAEAYRAQGYNGDELVGITGVEGWGEAFLAGKRGAKLLTISPTGETMAEVASAQPSPGGNISLSIDTQLQQQAELILGARRGAIVVMEPTGFVKAMASYPRFDSNDFAAGINAETWSQLLNNEDRPLVNRAAQGAYPPASLFKIVSIAAAMEKLGWSPDREFYCSGTWDGLGENFPKKCWLETGHGHINLKDGLTQSCDVVFYEVGLALHREDPALLPEMARAFGFGQPTGIQGVDETGGVVPDNEWKMETLGEAFFDGDAVNMAIGQGYTLATPLQVSQMMAVVSNDGLLYRPQIVQQLSSRDSGDQFFRPEQVNQIPVSPENWAIIQNALFGVAHGKRGTAREAFAGIEYTIIGKTGTAETGIDAPHAWFIGYSPADIPEIVIVVMLENAGEGSKEAAPLFRLMLESYFDWLGKEE
ncbi:MAG: penicillin-binding protein 2 [Anaerolineaceae bacterium 4572_5.1]|nr:MAG: penicillin-binding protein 2 [Anaerolineaceae bacterium 4572_5.1]